MFRGDAGIARPEGTHAPLGKRAMPASPLQPRRRGRFQTSNDRTKRLRDDVWRKGMKRVFAVEGRPVVLDVPEPELRPGEVLVAPVFSAISAGTESGIIRGSAPETPDDDIFKRSGPPAPKLRNAGVHWAGVRP